MESDEDLNKKIKESIFKKIEMKFINLKIKFLNKYVAAQDEYYSLTEPPEELMKELHKTFWIQPYKEDIK